MKIRNGFVSNSSSSSFCLVGSAMYDEDFKEFLGKAFKGENWENQERVREKLEKLGMECYDACEYVVFGYPVETDTTIDSQIEWTQEEFKKLGINKKARFDYGEVNSG